MARGALVLVLFALGAFLSTSFLAPQCASRRVETQIPAGAAEPSTQSPMQSLSAVVPLLGLAAFSARARRPKSALVPMAGALPVSADEPCTVMHTAGGRRKRLGVGGRICMLTGLKKFKGITRTYHLKKNCRYWRPNCQWMNLWWGREKKWVRLYISMAALRKLDERGLEYMAKRAGLDLYAWSKEHWEPGSRQPLRLKVSTTGKAQKDKRLWPDYDKYLNKDRPLAEIFAGPKYPNPKKPLPWAVRRAQKNPATPPKGLQVSMASSSSSDA